MNESFRTFVVANPKAGAGQVERDWDRIERLLGARLSELDFAFTEGPGHATLLTREALRNGWEMIVAIGGDGTNNEVVNGFFEPRDAEELDVVDGFVRIAGPPRPIAQDAVLGFLPMGTGGDFRRTIELTGDLKETVDVLAGRETRTIDAGEMGFVDHDGKLAARMFLNIAGGGFGGRVDQLANKTWKGLGGGLSFRIASTRGWMTWKNVELEVVIDGDETIKMPFFNVVVANGEYFGGGMWVARGASIEDGEFDMVFMGDMSKWQSAILMAKIYDAKHFAMPDIFRRTGKELAVKSHVKRPVLLDVDGEQPGQFPATFVMRPGSLRIKV
jgi:diacylglycerol kinase family enzyme